MSCSFKDCMDKEHSYIFITVDNMKRNCWGRRQQITSVKGPTVNIFIFVGCMASVVTVRLGFKITWGYGIELERELRKCVIIPWTATLTSRSPMERQRHGEWDAVHRLDPTGVHSPPHTATRTLCGHTWDAPQTGRMLGRARLARPSRLKSLPSIAFRTKRGKASPGCIGE